MSNALYTKAKQGLIDGSIDMDTDTIKAVFVDGADYTPNLSTHQYLSDIPSAARVATSRRAAEQNGHRWRFRCR